MPLDKPLEAKLERLSAIVGKPSDTSPLDPLLGVGGPVKWLSVTGDPEGLCELVHKNTSGSTIGMPSKGDLQRVGGFWAHVAVRRLESGLVVAEVHEEEPHQLVVYLNEIIECRGKREDGSYNFGYPGKLMSLNAHGFHFGLNTGKLVVSPSSGPVELPATFTKGEKSLSLGRGTEFTFSYAAAEPISLQGSQSNTLSIVPTYLKASLRSPGTEFDIAFYLTQDLSYTCVLSSGVASFSFNPSGRLERVTTTDNASKITYVNHDRWGLIFDLYFPRGTSFPSSIDVIASMSNLIASVQKPQFPLDIGAILSLETH